MKRKLLLFVAMAMAGLLYANNISLTNLQITGQNTTNNYMLVQFDISWENSWRTSSAPNNWDAAWIFVKYRVTVVNGGDGLWKHAWLNNTGHTAPSGSTIDIGLLDPASDFNAGSNPGMGAFIYRSADGTGPFTKTGVQLRWNYGANGLADNAILEIQVYAIEMVCVPQGSFYLGTGGTEVHSFTAANNISGPTVPFQITATPPVLQGNNAGSNPSNLSARYSWDLTLTLTAPFAIGYPTGFNPFYCMKYEISQQGYVDFLNSLPAAQASDRYPGQNTYRHAITVSSNVYSTSLPYVGCNFLSWADVSAWFDWSALRPMTELEYEKACRGTASPVAGEYAWGSTSITAATGLSNSGAINETASNSGANACYYQWTAGPVRAGAFATSSSTRQTSGATYYGVMEMSGNLHERAITAGHYKGRAFKGTHGNGTLAADGNADVFTWPGIDAVGTGLHGGSWYNYPQDLPVSNRSNSHYPVTNRGNHYGGRGVRSFPVCPSVSTAAVGGISGTMATGGGNIGSDGGGTVTARGVCWGTSSNPTTAGSHTTDGDGTGLFVSNLTVLTPGTKYFVRAYATNNVGTVYGNEVWFIAVSCGSSFTVNHQAGSIAPVTKTVIYGTVNNIPGELSKCWITSNLGAERQATAADDATEESAGWYWQFNRKQGYMHDGSNRTPNTTWITTIDEIPDWQTANDPCALEIGSGWRIPTFTEWTDVDASGGWIDWNGPWNSGLKLHAAGLLVGSDGSSLYRGSYGYFWSSSQYTNSFGWDLYFYSGNCELSNSNKAYGFSVRCINDPAIAATISTTVVSNIATMTATGGGNITSDGGAAVTARGVCWSTSPNPVTTGSHTTDGSGTGEFVSSLTGLIQNTLYYVRAYATNSMGTAYGNQLSFTTSYGAQPCSGTPTVLYEGITYNTVQVGTQCWLKENLNVGTRINISQNQNATNGIKEKYCYNNLESNCDIYGGIYQWNEMMQGSTTPGVQGICPSGWHLPTDGEWTTLKTYMGGDPVAGGKLKETGTSHWQSPNYAATNESGFSALPGGFRNYTGDGSFALGTYGYWWTSTLDGSTNAWRLYMSNNYEGADRSAADKAYGFHARCLKD